MVEREKEEGGDEWTTILGVDGCFRHAIEARVSVGLYSRNRVTYPFRRKQRGTVKKKITVSGLKGEHDDEREREKEGLTASLTASETVGWAWQVRATSSAEAPYSSASVASPMSSPATDEMMWQPRTLSVCFSVKTLTNPSVSLFVFALERKTISRQAGQSIGFSPLDGRTNEELTASWQPWGSFRRGIRYPQPCSPPRSFRPMRPLQRNESQFSVPKGRLARGCSPGCV